jgi:hypothetical protein
MLLQKTTLAVVAGTLIAVGGQGVAEELDKSPLQLYVRHITFSQYVCSRSDYTGCIEENEKELKKKYRAALPTVRGARAKDALKEHYIVALTALRGIRPGVGERKIDYDRRQQTLKDKVSEAWARFEVETD